MSAWGSETSVAASSSPPRTNAMTSCTRPETRRPNQFISATRPMIPPVAISWVLLPPPSGVGDVRRGEAGRGRCPDRDREVEAPADHRGRAGTEGLARVGRDAAAVGVAGAERRERQGQRDRQEEQRCPGEQGGGAGGGHGQRGQRDHAGAEHGADGHRGTLGHVEVTTGPGGVDGRCGGGCERGHGSSRGVTNGRTERPIQRDSNRPIRPVSAGAGVTGSPVTLSLLHRDLAVEVQGSPDIR